MQVENNESIGEYSKKLSAKLTERKLREYELTNGRTVKGWLVHFGIA